MINSNYKLLIARALKREAYAVGKPLSWFRFAKKHTKSEGYRFLANKEAQINILERVARSLSTRLVNLTTGQIMDILSELVNAV